MNANELLRDQLARGVLQTADGRIIARPGMTLSELEASAGANWQPRPGTGDGWYAFPDVVLGGRRCGVRIRVDHGAVRLACVVATEPETPLWNAALEKQKHDAWLLSVFGHPGPYLFPWGEIQTEEDLKGGTGPIVLSYSP